jgi:PAS domain S-box-containing protein
MHVVVATTACLVFWLTVPAMGWIAVGADHDVIAIGRATGIDKHWLCIAGLMLVVLAVKGRLFARAKAMRLNCGLRVCKSRAPQECQEHHQAEAATDHSEARYRGLIEHLSLGIFEATLDGRLIHANSALAASAGYASRREMIASADGVDWAFCIPPAHRAEITRRAVESNGPISYEAQFRDHRGREIPTRVTLRAVRDSSESGLYLEGYLEDITEAKHAREFASAQRDLGIRLAAVSGLDQALQLCLETSLRVTGMDGGAVYLFDRATGTVVLAIEKGFRPECPHRMRSHPELDAALMTVRQPVYTEHGEACEVGQLCGCDGILRARAIVPIFGEGSVIGWLVAKTHQWAQVPTLSRAALETLATQIGAAISRIQAQEALAASQSQLNALFNSLTDFLLVLDSTGRILEINQPVIDRLGYSREDLRGAHMYQLYSADCRARMEALLPEVLRGRENLICVNHATSDGTPIPVEVKLTPGLWGGRTVIIAAERDVTERRRAEEQAASLQEKTALLKEIHHRIKNNLQVICSLLSLQASQLQAGQDPRPFLESQARVHTIALLHERLYQARDFSQIDFGKYLAALAEHILRAERPCSSEIALRLETEPIWLDQDVAMPCGLIVNELLTNCCKYAFRDDRNGEICLSLKRLPDDRLVLSVGDNGVGLPAGLDFRNPLTLGLQLVDDMVAQVKGSWNVDSTGGTRFEIVLPARDARQ